MEYITLAYIVLLTGTQYFIGYILTQSAGRFMPGTDKGQVYDVVAMVPFYWLLGLLVHITSAFILKCLGANWWVATLAPLMLFVPGWRFVRPSVRLLRSSLKSLVSIPFLLWLLVHLFLGNSLFSVGDGVFTPWVNNYGDLTFHLGMINHFTWQGDFPPEYHIYTGETLSYPYFVNVWAAMLWYPAASFLPALSLVFAAQWVLIWSAAYAFLTFGRARVLPWVLLFGGGSLLAVTQQPEVYSWRLINEGYPWTTWLSTIWVTQRSALMGMVVCLASTALVLNLPRLKNHGVLHCAMAGLLLGLSPLVHTHYFMVTALFLGGLLFIQAGVAIRENSKGINGVSVSLILSLNESKRFLFLFVLTCISIVFFPLLMGKSGMASVMLGWTVPVKPMGGASVAASLGMWVKNAAPWFLAMGFVWAVAKMHVRFVLLFGLFLLGNILKLATWDWDQLKFFLAVFTLFVVVWSDVLREDISWKLRASHFLLAILLIAPGVYEAKRIWGKPPNYQVYDIRKLELADLIRRNTSPDAVIASPTDHNSAATLGGRTLFYGYPGTLASHSLAYQSREFIQLNLHNIGQCKNLGSIAESLCPTHVVWDHASKKYWHRILPDDSFKKIASTHDGKFGLYEVLEK